MDYVKREESNIIDEENYKIYMESLQKSHQIETMEYQHTPISMEQLHQAVQSSLTNNSLTNFQLPISPRQMSTLMLKTNHLTRSLNFNDLQTHLPKNLTMEMELIPILNESQNIRHDDLMARNLDVSLTRNVHNDIELQNGLLHEHELRSMEVNQNLRINDLNREIPHDLQNEIELSHLARQNLENEILSQEETRRSLAVQTAVDSHLLEQHLAQRLEQNMALRLDQNVDRLDQSLRIDQTLAQRLDQTLAQRLDQTLVHRLDPMLVQRLDQTLTQRLDQTLAQRLDQTLTQRLDQTLAQRLDQTLAQRLDPRLFNSVVLHEQKLDQNEHLFPMPCHIKAEQEDEGYFYENVNQGLNGGINAEIPQQTDHTQPNTNLHHEQLYAVYNNPPIPALNPIDLYSRPQNFIPNYPENRENPQNLVIHRQFDNSSPYTEEIKKLRQDDRKDKMEEPKENLKPTDQNKMFYEYSNDYVIAEKNENDMGLNNKITEEVTMSIKGEYICYKCNDIFPSKRILKSHAKTCENTDNMELEKLGKFSCTQCAYRCQSPAILKIHERTHTGEKPYACTFCDYKSGQKNNVAKHILVHMKQKPFACRYCEYRCAQKNNLVVHERTHTGYKPFACPFCDYRTVQKPNLVKHMYLHTDQKPFSCDMCNYRCVQKTNLTKHKQRHLNEKNDKVDVKNPIKPYKPRQKSVKCPECPYRCVQKSSLEKHLQFKHSSDENSDNGLNLMKSDEFKHLSDENGLNAMKSVDFKQLGDENGLNLMKSEDFKYLGDENGLNLMKSEDSETIQNLSVKKGDQFVCDKNVDPLQV